jgi:putative ABC transport system ATP-binding protein
MKRIMTESPEPVLRAEALSMRFVAPEGTISLFEELELSIAAGESVAILGASGCGKSTLLGLLAGLDQPTSGRVSLAGRDMSRMDEDERAELRAGRVGFVFQAFHLLPGLTALENVMLPGELAGWPDVRAAASEALARVGLGERIGHYPAQLSGGEQQRVALARAIVTQPAVLFADEPTGNLDRDTGGQVIDRMFEMNRDDGTTLVLVTHDPSLAQRCERVLRLDKGVLEASAA